MENPTNAANSDNVTSNPSQQAGLGSLGGDINSQSTTSQATNTEVTTNTSTAYSKFNEILTEDGKFTEKWTERLPDGLKDYSKTLSKFKDPTELMASYASLEKAFSQKTGGQATKLPGDDASEEDWSKFREAIGAPKEAKEYNLTRPEDIPEEKWNGKLAEKVGSIAVKYGLPKKALQELVGEYNESMKSIVSDAEQNQVKVFEATVQKFNDEWKTDAKTNWQKTSRAATALGLSLDDPSLVREDLVKALMKVDDLLSEDQKLVTGEFSETYQDKLSKLQSSPEYQGKKGFAAQQKAHAQAVQLVTMMQRR